MLQKANEEQCDLFVVTGDMLDKMNGVWYLTPKYPYATKRNKEDDLNYDGLRVATMPSRQRIGIPVWFRRSGK